jgi:hypothetical protein
LKFHITKEPEVRRTSMTRMHFRSMFEESAIVTKENDHDCSHPFNQGKYPIRMGRGSHNEA